MVLPPACFIMEASTYINVHLRGRYNAYAKIISTVIDIIGASLTEPHTNQYYKKTAVLMYMYVCMYVVIRQTRAHKLIAHAHNYHGKDRQHWPRLTPDIAHQKMQLASSRLLENKKR